MPVSLCRCGVLQAGDQVLQVEGADTTELSLEEVRQALREARPRCRLHVQFHVAESVTPGSGTYVVRLAKGPGGAGLSLGGGATAGDPLVISHVRRGSPAHR